LRSRYGEPENLSGVPRFAGLVQQLSQNVLDN
jgi:hypothetical protein